MGSSPCYCVQTPAAVWVPEQCIELAVFHLDPSIFQLKFVEQGGAEWPKFCLGSAESDKI